MKDDDTIELLQECNAGSKMAVNAIDDVLDKVKINEFKNILIKCKEQHSQLGDEIHDELNHYGVGEKEPNFMAKSMAKVKTEVKIALDENDKTIADLMTEGCNMGVKSLNRYLNEYKGASKNAINICKKLIKIEEDCLSDIQCFL